MISSRNALLALLVGLGLSSSVFAGASNKNPNPFGNGSYFSQNGTFSAVLRSPEQPNFLGVVQVSTTTASYNSTNVTNPPPGSGWATVFTPAIPNFENVTASNGILRVTNQVPASTNVTVSTNLTTNYRIVSITNAVPVTNTAPTTTFVTITNTNVTVITNNIPIVVTITNTNVISNTNITSNSTNTSFIAVVTTNQVTRTNSLINLQTNITTYDIQIPSNSIVNVSVTNTIPVPFTTFSFVTNTTTSPAYTYIGPDTNTAYVSVTNVYTNGYITNITYQVVTNQTYLATNPVTIQTNTTVIGLTNIYFTNYWTNIYSTNYGQVGAIYTTNYINIPGIQWNGSAFGVIYNNNAGIAVSYTLTSYVSQVYTNNNNITQLTLTNLNGGGQFTAPLQNSYPNQTFSGSGYCSVQPTIGGNPSSNSPILNFTNTVSGFRLSY